MILLKQTGASISFSRRVIYKIINLVITFNTNTHKRLFTIFLNRDIEKSYVFWDPVVKTYCPIKNCGYDATDLQVHQD